jgi:ACS family hexuronate transporter-like MFS transporter
MNNGRSKWLLLAVLSCITIINYVDRQTVSILYSSMNKELRFPETTYSTLVTLFLIAYTAMYTIGGWLVDRIGAKLGLALALAWWSVATALTSLVRSAGALEICRVLLAIGQPIVFSAGVKVCAEFFPSRQRAMATGIFSAGSGLGALISTPVLAAIALRWGWRTSMIVPALIGLFLVPLWLITYNRTTKQPDVLPTEATTIGWGEIIRLRRAWALILPRAVGDPLWYFCLFWIPEYLQQARHMDLKQIALLGWLPFFFADIGSILGGSISDMLIRQGTGQVRSRIIVLVCIAAVSPAGCLIGLVPSLGMAITLMGLVAFVSQCWTTTTTALATDIFPKSSVGAIVGMMGTAGGIGGAAFAQIIGSTVHHHGFAPAFVFAALLTPIAVILLLTLLRGQRTIERRSDRHDQCMSQRRHIGTARLERME